MSETTPRIEVRGRGRTPWSSTVEMAALFWAHFERSPAVTIEIEIVDRRPVVRWVKIGSDNDDLASGDLRVPLTDELVPAAVREAVKITGASVIFGPAFSETARPLPEGVKPGQVGMIGPIRVVGRQVKDLPDYDQAAIQATRPRRGRPPIPIPLHELEEIGATYRETRSYSKTAAHHGLSVAKARRRVQRAREAGLQC